MQSSNLPLPLSASDKKSFAFATVRDRMPTILTKTIDGLHRNRRIIGEQYSMSAEIEIKIIVGRIAKLRNELQTDKPFEKITDEYKDVSTWNIALDELKKEEYSWFKSSWLFCECYMYRRIIEAMQLSANLKEYDPFAGSKMDSFMRSLTRIKVVSAKVMKFLCNKDRTPKTLKEELADLIQLALWGNQCDLSLTAGNPYYADDKDVTLHDSKSRVLVDDTSRIWKILEKKSHAPEFGAKVHIILDNSGFELFTDLCLAEYMMSRNLAKKISFHVKSLPWFVSDATEQDIDYLINQMQTCNNFAASKLGILWSKRLKDGDWEILKSDFWTTPYGYSEMRKKSATLYKRLMEGDLAIFKGDLNYRKLLNDLKWDPTESFNEVLDTLDFSPTNICALRTLKAEIIVGLEAGQAEKVASTDQDWLVNGKWGVIHCT